MGSLKGTKEGRGREDDGKKIPEVECRVPFSSSLLHLNIMNTYVGFE